MQGVFRVFSAVNRVSPVNKHRISHKTVDCAVIFENNIFYCAKSPVYQLNIVLGSDYVGDFYVVENIATK